MTMFIGIDGGGTKTSAALADAHGNIVHRVKAGPSNPNGYSINRIQEQFQTIREQLSASIPHWGDCVIFAGVAGTTHAETHAQMMACLRHVFGDVKTLRLDHDGMNALASVTYGDPGVIQIAGTGSVTFGLGKHGERCRIGGWGYLLGDEGSGFDLGRRALIHVMKAYDERGPATELMHLALQKWDLHDPEDLIPHVYSHDVKETVASFTYELFQAAQGGDKVACTIIIDAAKDLAQSICTALKQLNLASEDGALVGLIGGAFQPLMIEALRQEIARQLPNPPQLIRPQVEPVIGSLAWAYKHAGLDPKALLKG